MVGCMVSELHIQEQCSLKEASRTYYLKADNTTDSFVLRKLRIYCVCIFGTFAMHARRIFTDDLEGR